MDQPKTQERRKFKRRNLAYYMLVKDSYTQQIIGHLVNISPSGLLIDSQKPIPLQKDFYLSLDITPDIAARDYIVFKARSKWCQPDAIEPFLYDIGFSIIEISSGDAAILQRIADKYASQDGYSFPPR